jgi:hypothetical protein
LIPASWRFVASPWWRGSVTATFTSPKPLNHPSTPEFTMKQTLTQRLLSLSLAGVFTLAMLGSVSQLFVGAEAQQANLAQRATPPAPRA